MGRATNRPVGMTDHVTADGRGWRAQWRVAKRRAAGLLRTALVVTIAATWIAFWGLVVRIQVVQAEYLSAAVTGLLFVVPAVVGLVAFLDLLPDPRALVPATPSVPGGS